MRKTYADFSDDRCRNMCLYCQNWYTSDNPRTTEHLPSKVFLDKPYPLDLQTIAACQRCNNGFSHDEEFVAAWIEYFKSMDENNGDIERALIQNGRSDSRLY